MDGSPSPNSRPSDRYELRLIGYSQAEEAWLVEHLRSEIDRLSTSDLEEYDYWYAFHRTEGTTLEERVLDAMDTIQQTFPDPMTNYGNCIDVVPLSQEPRNWDNRPHPTLGPISQDSLEEG